MLFVFVNLIMQGKALGWSESRPKYVAIWAKTILICTFEVKNERRELEYRKLERRGPNAAEPERRHSERRSYPNDAVLNAAATGTTPLGPPQLPERRKLKYCLYTECRQYRKYFYIENWPKKRKSS